MGEIDLYPMRKGQWRWVFLDGQVTSFIVEDSRRSNFTGLYLITRGPGRMGCGRYIEFVTSVYNPIHDDEVSKGPILQKILPEMGL